MRKLIETAALGLSLCLGGWSHVPYVHAQDPEEGAVDLNEASRPSAKEPAGGTDVEAPPGTRDSEDFRGRSVESTETAAKEPVRHNFRVYVGPRIALGGGFRPKGQEYTWTADPTFGAQLGVDYTLLKYFALGFEMRTYWAEQSDSNRSYLFLDFALKPRAYYRIKPYPIEIYLAAVGGPSVNVPGTKVPTANGSAVKEKGKLGGVVGIAWGGSYFFNEHWALNAEFGWNWTFMRVDTWVQRRIADGVPVQLVPTEAKIRLAQLAIAVNMLFKF